MPWPLSARWYEKKILSPDFFTKGYQENRTEIEGNRVGMNYTHPWGGVVGGGMGSMANDPSARWIWIDVPAGPVRKGKNFYSPLLQNVYPFRKGFEQIDKVLKQANHEAEIVLSPELRYHGLKATTTSGSKGRTGLRRSRAARTATGLSRPAAATTSARRLI